MRSYINLAVLALAASTAGVCPALAAPTHYRYGNLLVEFKGWAFLIRGILNSGTSSSVFPARSGIDTSPTPAPPTPAPPAPAPPTQAPPPPTRAPLTIIIPPNRDFLRPPSHPVSGPQSVAGAFGPISGLQPLSGPDRSATTHSTTSTTSDFQSPANLVSPRPYITSPGTSVGSPPHNEPPENGESITFGMDDILDAPLADHHHPPR
jgi:hypothetical protein